MPSIRNEGKDIGGSDEGGYAEEADELGLNETRHDQCGDVCHGGDTGDREEDALVGFRMELPYRSEEAYFILLIALVILDSQLRDEFLLL